MLPARNWTDDWFDIPSATTGNLNSSTQTEHDAIVMKEVVLGRAFSRQVVRYPSEAGDVIGRGGCHVTEVGD